MKQIQVKSYRIAENLVLMERPENVHIKATPGIAKKEGTLTIKKIEGWPCFGFSNNTDEKSRKDVLATPWARNYSVEGNYYIMREL